MNLQKEFLTFFHSNFDPKGPVLLAVSGGVDSMVMAHLFKVSGIPFSVAHVNFKLRGEESEGDADFVKDWCDINKVEFHCKTLPAEEFATANKISIQMSSRQLRYEWFNELLQENKYSFVATAHHRTDNMETVLMNLIRGTGIEGMHGIRRRNKKVIRPLLFTGRKQIEEYATENKISFREDSSNNTDKYTRNKIRHDITPEILKINPSAEITMMDNVLRFTDYEQIVKEYISSGEFFEIRNNELYIPINRLREIPFAATVLYEILKRFEFNYDQCIAIAGSLDSESGVKFLSKDNIRLVKDREYLIVSTQKTSTKTYQITEDISLFSEEGLVIALEILDPRELKIMPHEEYGYFDRELLQFPLTLRHWKHGDHFIPYGGPAGKKLSDFFTDHKYSLPEKEKAWLLCSGEDIIWVVGKRTDNRYRVQRKTKKVLLCRMISS